MIWVPLMTACAMALLVLGLHHWQQRRQVDGTRIYRARFVQLVSQLDSITASVNHLEGHLERIADPKVLDYYEKTLKILETLLAAICKLPPFGKEPHELNAAFFLTKDCRERVVKTQKAFRQILRGHEGGAAEVLADGDKTLKATGCYFCSRPVVANRFSKVKVRLDGDVKQVMSCSICREELESTKKVKVLYFMKDGQPVHWSQIGDYTPSEDYWNINKRDPVRTVRRLELVYTAPPVD